MLTVADTAYSIAVVRAEESLLPPAERLFEDPYGAIFAAAGAHAREGTERFLALPFFREGVRLRTRFIDEVVREGLGAGLDQVVLLQNAGWDINAAVAPTDLLPPAFNEGSPTWGTKDFANGLAVMINGVQHVIVVAKEYSYDACAQQYTIKLEYVMYDVFGLDDDDLDTYGGSGTFSSAAGRGITAWWQLQHQFGYAPLITRISFERVFTVSTR